MKTLYSYTRLVLAIILLLTSSMVMAQVQESERRKQKARQELKEQKVIQEEEMKIRKEMLEDQRRQMKEMELEHADHVREMEAHSGESARVRSSVRSGSIVPSSGVYTDRPYYIPFGQENQSQLTLRKTFRETTSSSGGEFDVESGISHFRCMINGSVRSGEIFIAIEYPDGKTFKELIINASADINFSQSISIKEGEEKKYIGNWSYVIKADKAEGDYMVQIQTN